MKLSEWQSGTIAPELPGVYQRIFAGFRNIELVRWDGKTWFLIGRAPSRQPTARSIVQRLNGYKWQWRGKL